MALRLSIVLLAVLAAGALPAAASADAPVSEEIVVLRDGGLTRSEQAHARVVPERDLPIEDVEVVSTDGDRERALAKLRADRDVVWAEPNMPRSLSAESLGGLLWGLQNTGQSVWWHRGLVDADIDAPEAWTTTRGNGLVIAVVDTGIDAGHPEFTGRLVPGYDFVEDDGDPQDTYGHGTHVAGTIAAAENGAGVVGVAPLAQIMPLRVLDDAGQGTSADVAAAFAYAADRGVRIVNASLGSPSPSLVERRAITEHPGTLFVVAAGNGGADETGDDVDGPVHEYPCVHDEPNVICVAATTGDDTPATFSNYGATSVDLSAPGQNIVSTFPRGRPTTLGASFATGDGYEVMEGTSMATPHVAGAAALVASIQPAWIGLQLKTALMDGADRIPALAGRSVTGGRLNAARAVNIAAGRPGAAIESLPGRLGPEILPPGEPAADPKAAQVATAARVKLRRLRLAGRPRVCRVHGCQARRATLSFQLSAGAEVTVRLQRRGRCTRKGCAWRPARVARRHEPQGRTRWTVGERLLGMRLRPGHWRVTLITSGTRAQRTFKVR